jgi:glycerol-3-phosphate acyltransferase PlsY
MLTANSLWLIVASYLWGSLSPSFFVARGLKGIDLRQYGSANVGSSNLGEQLGRAWMFAIGTVDLVKGLVPVVLARVWGFDLGTIAWVGLATVIGHNWSPYLGFKGGRGMAATIGVLFAWDVRLAVVLLLVIAIGWAIKQGAPSSIVGLILLAPSARAMGDMPEIVLACVLLTTIIAIKRLEANRLPLPHDPREKRAVLLRRLWMDRDVPPAQPWQERKQID